MGDAETMDGKHKSDQFRFILPHFSSSMEYSIETDLGNEEYKIDLDEGCDGDICSGMVWKAGLFTTVAMAMLSACINN